MPVGRVIRSHSHQHYVLIEGQEVLCRPRGKFRLDKQDVLAGDWVEVHLEGDEGRIDKVLPRSSQLQRPAIANVDQALVVYTLKEPDADSPFLDRILVHVHAAGVEPVIVLNKIDLLHESEVEEFIRLYGYMAGYPVIPISAKLEIGLEDLRPLLPGRTSVLAGHSGVGKSRLIRALEPGRDDVKVGDLSEKLGRGKHTTRHVELIRQSGGGLLADTPGFTYLEFGVMDKFDLCRFFPEFLRFSAICRFDDCLHRREPDCGVRAAVGAEKVSRSRYESYLHFLEEVEAQKRW